MADHRSCRLRPSGAEPPALRARPHGAWPSTLVSAIQKAGVARLAVFPVFHAGAVPSALKLCHASSPPCCLNPLQLWRLFSEEIFVSDFQDVFEAQLQEKGIQEDIVCCMQNLQARKNIKRMEASHNKGRKDIQNSIRSENYTFTFELEEEKFPFFGKKYKLKFAKEVMFENHCLVHFPILTRTQFPPMLGNCGASLVDSCGKLVARSYNILGMYSTFVFQKPDLDAIPPIVTPDLNDADNAHEELWRRLATVDDGRRS